MGRSLIQICDSWICLPLKTVEYCPICGEICLDSDSDTRSHIENCLYNIDDADKQGNENFEICQETSNCQTCKLFQHNLNTPEEIRQVENEKEENDKLEETNVNIKEGEIKKELQPKIKKFCDICVKYFKTNYQLKTHRLQVHENHKPEKCVVCDKSFRERTSLKNHMLSHTGEKPFSCSKCVKSFRRKESLQYHEQSHNKDAPRECICSACAKTFRNVRDLRGHERLMHGDLQQYPCKECDEILLNKTSYSNHMKLNHGQGQLFNCSFCSQKFPTVTNLKKHESTHTGEKPYACSYCPKTFRLAYLKNVHEQRHTRSGAHKCQQCNRSFPQASEYRRHNSTVHQDDKRCKECNRVFKNKSALIKHYLEHVDQDIGKEDEVIINTTAGKTTLNETPAVKTRLIQLVTAGPSKELASLQLPSAPGGPLQTISVKTEKLRTIDDTITTKTVYVMDPDVPDSDNTVQTGVSSIIQLPYTLGVPQYKRGDKETGSTIVIPRGKYSILPD